MSKGHPVGKGRLDLLVADAVVVELKVVDALNAVHHAQMISYLKTTGHRLGLLINFNVVVLRDGIKRVICTHNASPASDGRRSARSAEDAERGGM